VFKGIVFKGISFKGISFKGVFLGMKKWNGILDGIFWMDF
jgi:hypothetical protein